MKSTGIARQREQGEPGCSGRANRDLEKAVGPDEIVSKSGAQRIAPPGSASDMTATFANDCVVDQADDWRVRGQLGNNGSNRNLHEQVAIHTLLGEQPIGCRPVAKLHPRRTKQARDGFATQTADGRQSQLLSAVKGSPLRERRAGHFEQLPPGVEDSIYGVFFTSGGGGC